jgi:SNF2 family DNA or RNA helicase
VSSTYVPHEYQKRAIRMLLGQAGAGLFLDPGLGKTSTVLAAFHLLKKKDLVNRMLVVAPIRPMYSVWPYEIQKWAEFNHLTIELCHGDNRIPALESDADIVVINPENLLWLFDPQHERWGLVSPWFDILCIDESTKFKSYSSKRFKLLQKYLHYFERRWILTGTPMPNTAVDLFSQTYIMDRGAALGRYITHFRKNFMYQPDPYNPYAWELQPYAFDKIVDRLSPLTLRLKAEDYLEMPPIGFNDVIVDLPPEVMAKYKEIEDEFIAEIEGETIVAQNAAAAGIKCRQIANGAVYNEDGTYVVLHDMKLEALEDLLEELSGKPLLILYEFKHDRERILARFPEVSALGEGAQKDDFLIQAFNKGKLPALLGHPASMGHGLNMQEVCCNVCWFGMTWNFEYYDQANRRVWRQGQQAPVMVHRIVSRGTIDGVVAQALRDKEASQEQLMKAISNASKRFEHGRD